MNGVIEGFYGRPWTWPEREMVARTAAAAGLAAFVYAPKDDRRHRAHWREPYDRDERRAFRTFASHLDGLGLVFGFGVSPLGIDHGLGADVTRFGDKLAAAADDGATWLLLGFDDLELRPGLAAAQARTARTVIDRLADWHPGVRVSFVPTVYAGTGKHPYVAELAGALAADVEVVWTGPTIIPATITAADLDAWRGALPHPVLLWDNLYADDYPGARAAVHAYTGRDPAVLGAVTGTLLNPCCGARAAARCVGAFGRFLARPGEDARDALEAILGE